MLEDRSTRVAVLVGGLGVGGGAAGWIKKVFGRAGASRAGIVYSFCHGYGIDSSRKSDNSIS